MSNSYYWFSYKTIDMFWVFKSCDFASNCLHGIEKINVLILTDKYSMCIVSERWMFCEFPTLLKIGEKKKSQKHAKLRTIRFRGKGQSLFNIRNILIKGSISADKNNTVWRMKILFVCLLFGYVTFGFLFKATRFPWDTNQTTR